jgi:hypothetical protein
MLIQNFSAVFPTLRGMTFFTAESQFASMNIRMTINTSTPDMTKNKIYMTGTADYTAMRTQQ